ncbi:MAG: helix-turn-helix transcriptional regulator [Bacilli bacterium]|nr:helix-turn-helix transcriptional regulator [Bacilli bacterium]
MNRSFNKKLRAYREDKDLSQREIAELIPMNQSNYSKIERGVQEPNLFQLKRISEILCVSVDELLDIDSKKYANSKLENLKTELENIYKKFFY